jgi:TRAP-type transport system periplasmic protein
MQRHLSRPNFLRALGALGAPAAGSPRACRAAETYTMRVSLSQLATSVAGVTMLHFASAVDRRSNGQVKIEIYPTGQLANEQGGLDALSTGVIDFVTVATAFLVPFSPQYQIFDMPFLLKDIAAAYRVLDGPVATDLFTALEPKGILGMSWGIGGFKQIETTSKLIVAPEDMKGLRVRIAGGGAISVACYQALGAIPVSIDTAEVFTALSQHTIDAIDFPLAGFYTNKHYLLAKHVAISNHQFSVIPLLGSKRKIDALPLPLQKILKEEAVAVTPFWRSQASRELATDIEILKKSGVTFTEIQYPAFRKAMDPVYAAVESKLGGEFLQRANRAANGTLATKR